MRTFYCFDNIDGNRIFDHLHVQALIDSTVQLVKTEPLQYYLSKRQRDGLRRVFEAGNFYPLRIDNNILMISRKDVFVLIWDHSLGKFSNH